MSPMAQWSTCRACGKYHSEDHDCKTPEPSDSDVGRAVRESQLCGHLPRRKPGVCLRCLPRVIQRARVQP